MLEVISSSSFEILLLSVRFELTNEKFFSVSSEMVCSYPTEASEVTTKFFFRVLCLLRRELYFSIISIREAFSSEGEKEESTSSSSSDSDSASDGGSASDSAPVLAIDDPGFNLVFLVFLIIVFCLFYQLSCSVVGCSLNFVFCCFSRTLVDFFE